MSNRLRTVLDEVSKYNKSTEIERLINASKSVALGIRRVSDSAADTTLDYSQIINDARSGINLAEMIRKSRNDQCCKKKSIYPLDFSLDNVKQVADLLAEALNLCDGKEAKAANEQMLLLTGSAGAGKTHMLVDLALKRNVEKLTSIVLFGDQFSALKDIWQFTTKLGTKNRYSLIEVLDKLETIGRSSKARTMLLIDGINETSPCRIWQNGLESLKAKLLDRPNVCVVISIRNGFQDLVATQRTINETMTVEHYGFGKDIWKAVQLFFGHYRVQWPEIPLLGPEFSNPLFLKLFSEAFSGKTPRSFRGHEGGTHIFEAYVKKADQKINKDLGISGRAHINCWNDLIKPIAVWMGENKVQEIPADKAVDIAETAYPGLGDQALTLMERHALITKSARVDKLSGNHDYFYRFSYQKFSDHLIVRFLLNSHLDSKSSVSEKKFLSEISLEQIVRPDERLGLLEALSAQIPERKNGICELIDYISEDMVRYEKVIDAFLDSLVWRKPEAIGKSAINYINNVVLKNERCTHNFYEVLLSVASIPNYKLNARTLHKLLEESSLTDRDQIWTMWLNHNYRDEGNAVDRLVSWARRAPGRDKVNPESALLTAIAISWFFTSSNRFLRDDATKAVIALLEHHPGVVADLIRMFETVNDPYVLERVLCSAYGALARNPQVDALKDASITLLDGFFKRNDCTHLLSRDYARGIVELAMKTGVLNGG